MEAPAAGAVAADQKTPVIAPGAEHICGSGFCLSLCLLAIFELVSALTIALPSSPAPASKCISRATIEGGSAPLAFLAFAIGTRQLTAPIAPGMGWLVLPDPCAGLQWVSFILFWSFARY